jgi:hypothetical protein
MQYTPDDCSHSTTTPELAAMQHWTGWWRRRPLAWQMERGGDGTLVGDQGWR